MRRFEERASAIRRFHRIFEGEPVHDEHVTHVVGLSSAAKDGRGSYRNIAEVLGRNSRRSKRPSA
jgi:hypothetical protein